MAAAPVHVALEVGSQRVFAVAVDWPGWSRAGRDEEAAIDALLATAPRYAAAMRGIVTRPAPPRAASSAEVVGQLPGSSGTDFGVPSASPDVDAEPVDAAALRRLRSFLTAAWTAFDRAADAAEGVTLATGPRGGGRDLAKIRAHVLESDGAYLSTLGGSAPAGADQAGLRAAFLESVGARARGELPDVGPRGGARWNARTAVRRAAWHALDHAWEIEDRRER